MNRLGLLNNFVAIAKITWKYIELVAVMVVVVVVMVGWYTGRDECSLSPADVVAGGDGGGAVGDWW